MEVPKVDIFPALQGLESSRNFVGSQIRIIIRDQDERDAVWNIIQDSGIIQDSFRAVE